MKQLSQSDLARPDVTLTIPVNKFHLLPASLKADLAHYIDRGNDAYFVYTVPCYVADAFEVSSKALGGMRNGL